MSLKLVPGMARTLLLVGAGAALGALAAPAAALAAHVGCGDVVTEDVTLDADLVGCQGAGLVIGADRVTVDLAGHSIESGVFNVAPGIDNSAGYDRVKIANGSISGFSLGVALAGADRNELHDLTVVGNARGIELADSDRNEIVRGEVSRNGSDIRVGAGIVLSDGSDRNRIADSAVAGNQGPQVDVASSSDNEVVSSTVTGTVAVALRVSSSPGTAIRRSAVTAATGAVSLSASDGSRIVSSELGGVRVRASNDVRIARNTIRALSLDGGADSVIRANVVGATLDDGILVGPAAAATRVVDNVSNGNFGDGIDVRAAGTLIRGNSADGNGELGILAVDGVIDGGGNSASGNLDPRQCVNVVCR